MVNELVEIIGLFKLGYTRQALTYLRKLLQKSQSRENLSEILTRLYTFTQDLIKEKQYKLSIQLLQILEEIGVELKDKPKLCDLKNNLSLCHRLSGNFNESLSKCLEALEIVAQNFEIRSKLPALHLNACAIYREDLKDLTNAKAHAELAYYFAKEMHSPVEGNSRTLAISMYNYGFICDELNDFKNAEKWYKETLKFCQEHFKEKIFIDNVLIKIRGLELKLKLMRKNSRKYEGSQPLLASRRGFSMHSPYENQAKARRLLFSQCSRRNKRFSPNVSTPIPRDSISSHEKSTENSVNSHEKRFKSKSIRPITKRMIVKNRPTDSVSRLVEELCDPSLELSNFVVKIQKVFRGYVVRKKFRLSHNVFAKKTEINGKLYVIFLKVLKNYVNIEAYNTESLIQLHSVNFSFTDLKSSFNLTDENWKIHKNRILESVCIEKRKILLKPKDDIIIYEGINVLGAEKYNITIKFIDENEKALNIIAKNEKRTNTYNFPLDPLQDPDNIKKKIHLILAKLKMKNGELKFIL